MLPVADLSTARARAHLVCPDRVEKREIPDLIELQVRSFAWFVEKGLRELFDEISPIRDFTGKGWSSSSSTTSSATPKYSELECRTRDITFAVRCTCRSSS